MAAKDFTRRYRQNPSDPGESEETALSQVEALWGRVFPGRELTWRDWKPVVTNDATGQPLEYSGNQMSDGEKAALFLGSRVFSAEPGILVVDEPETHFHSLLAVRLWNELEDARPDIRFVYITHDLTFALSRRDTQYVLASPTAGLRIIELGDDLPSDVAEALLGSASLSFYASRVVFCEGEETSLDGQLYNAWFDGVDTVVRPVRSCGMVLRCVDALKNSGVAQSLGVTGVIDGDYHSASFLAALPPEVHALIVHEVESLFCLPGVVQAACEHTSKTFNFQQYASTLQAFTSEQQRQNVVVERWKARIRPSLAGIVAQANSPSSSLENLVNEMAVMFDSKSWSFSPQDMLEEEKKYVEAALPGGSVEDFLCIVPGKQLLAIAARTAGLDVKTYVSLIISSLSSSSGDLKGLLRKLVATLESILPARRSPGSAV